MNEKVIVIGAGGHAKVVADAIRKSGDTVLGFLDDHKIKNTSSFYGAEILGAISEYEKYTSEAHFIIAIGNNPLRKFLAESLKCRWYTAVHPSAVIGEGAEIGDGSFVGAGAIINADAVVGNHVIVNTRAVVEHDCSVGNYTHLAPSSTMCGRASVGELTLVGARAVLTSGVKICSGTNLAAGSVVAQNIEKSEA